MVWRPVHAIFNDGKFNGDCTPMSRPCARRRLKKVRWCQLRLCRHSQHLYLTLHEQDIRVVAAKHRCDCSSIIAAGRRRLHPAQVQLQHPIVLVVTSRRLTVAWDKVYRCCELGTRPASKQASVASFPSDTKARRAKHQARLIHRCCQHVPEVAHSLSIMMRLLLKRQLVGERHMPSHISFATAYVLQTLAIRQLHCCSVMKFRSQ